MNRGSEAIREKLPNHGDQARLTEEMRGEGIEIDAPKVSRIFNGRTLPNMRERAWLEDHYGIGWRLWDEAAESSEPSGPAAAE